MERSTVLAQLHRFIAEQILDGKSTDLDETTPLLEWGVINSVEIMRLFAFIKTQFGLDIPPSQMIADNFVNLGAITDMVLSQQSKAAMPALDKAR